MLFSVVVAVVVVVVPWAIRGSFSYVARVLSLCILCVPGLCVASDAEVEKGDKSCVAGDAEAGTDSYTSVDLPSVRR